MLHIHSYALCAHVCVSCSSAFCTHPSIWQIAQVNRCTRPYQYDSIEYFVFCVCFFFSISRFISTLLLFHFDRCCIFICIAHGAYAAEHTWILHNSAGCLYLFQSDVFVEYMYIFTTWVWVVCGAVVVTIHSLLIRAYFFCFLVRALSISVSLFPFLFA